MIDFTKTDHIVALKSHSNTHGPFCWPSYIYIMLDAIHIQQLLMLMLKLLQYIIASLRSHRAE